MYPKVEILGLHLPTYGIMGIFALMVLVVLGLLALHNAKLPLFDGMVLGAYGLLGAYFGAKLLFILQHNIELSFNTEADWLYFFSNGGSAYGGILLGLFFSRVGAYIHKIEYEPYIEKTIYLLPLCHGIWKIGCHCAGCCYGIPYEGPGSIFVINEFYTDGVSLFPIQIVEAIVLFVITFVLFRSRQRSIWMYMDLYGICRFVIEFLRNKELKTYIGIFSDIQYLCIIMFFAFTIITFVRRHSNEEAV